MTTTEREPSPGFRLTVLNPGGRDPAQDFSSGWPGPTDPGHPPVNFHGYEMFQQPPDFLSWIKAKLVLKSPAMYNIKNADYLFSYGGKITDLLLSLGVPKKRVLELPTGISAEWLVDAPGPSGQLRTGFR